MCAKKGPFDPKSTLALLRSYAEISSVHGEKLILLHNCLLIFQEFNICWANLFSPGSSGSFWWFLLWLAPPTSPGKFLRAGRFFLFLILSKHCCSSSSSSSWICRMIEPSQAWKLFQSRWMNLTFLPWPSARTGWTFSLWERLWK